MYVWFDALVNYVSTLGWPENNEQFEKFWVHGTPVQYCGKDNLRQQSAMWQAMLMSAGLAPSHTIVIDGFVTGSGGVKMSKSLGNVMNPYDIVAEYGTDALRYFVLRELQPFEDSPFTLEQFKQSYNANLANGLGNLVSRIMKMATAYKVSPLTEGERNNDKYFGEIGEFENFDIKDFLDGRWVQINNLDAIIQRKEPFKKIKTDPEQAKDIVRDLLIHLFALALSLEPILPDTAKKIKDCILENKVPEKPLFMRVD
jgi:methionyl-tRNA synthetase